MQTEALTHIKQQIVLLDENSKKDLAEFLAEELVGENKSQSLGFTDKERAMQTEWLKANREKYAGKYVALSGNKMVGEGKTHHEARRQANENGFEKVFTTFVYSENDVPFGGW